MIRVRVGVISWNVTAPSTCPFWPLDRQMIRSLGIWSRIVASHVRCDRKIWAFQLILVSSRASTFSTFFMNDGKAPNSVHVLYATSIGTPTSIVCRMLVDLVAPPPLPPLLPPLPVTASLTPEPRPLT